MASLVNELLSFSKTALGSANVKLQTLSVLDAVNEAVRREQRDGAQIVAQVDPALRVNAEPQLLTRAIANLLRNAIAYAGTAGPITVSAQATDTGVALSIADCGPGVPEVELDKIFDPFYRLDASRDRATGGVGLGLAIVKTCVESCGGAVTCRNRQPSGLEVTLWLPAAT
jgi:two-component system sensor histidine kinase CpxA